MWYDYCIPNETHLECKFVVGNTYHTRGKVPSGMLNTYFLDTTGPYFVSHFIVELLYFKLTFELPFGSLLFVHY